jgi:hypothetical protein
LTGVWNEPRHGLRPVRGRQPYRDEASGLDSSNEVRAMVAQHDFDGLHQIGQALARAAQNRYGLRIDCAPRGSPLHRMQHACVACTCFQCILRR